MEDDSPVLALSTLKKKRYSDVPLIAISLETPSHKQPRLPTFACPIVMLRHPPAALPLPGSPFLRS
jgi:hypothetical protein